jgi:hypothetical protein
LPVSYGVAKPLPEFQVSKSAKPALHHGFWLETAKRFALDYRQNLGSFSMPRPCGEAMPRLPARKIEW